MAAMLAAQACGPNTTTEGELGNGSFTYQCVDENDNACDGATSGGVPLPSAIAVGASFSISYSGSSDALPLESVSPSILGGSDGDFAFIQAGSAGIIVPATGGVLDFTVLHGADIASVAGFDAITMPDGCRSRVASGAGGATSATGSGGSGGSDSGGAGGATTGVGGGADAGQDDAGAADGVDAGTGAGDAGSSVLPPPGSVGTIQLVAGDVLDIHLEPVDATGAKLAGSVQVVAASVNDGIVTIGPPSFSLMGTFATTHGFELCGVSAGASTILVTIGTKAFSVPVQVVSAP